MMLTAPYNNAMRIGSGFNSFTQALCINDAVIKDNRKPATETDLQVVETPGGETSQMVTYSARFVQSASDVLDSLNVSGSVTVKLDSVGGGDARISYLQTEQIKSSDLNYLITVKVINQKLVAPDVTRFNPVPNLPPTSFTDTYGDTFISGFVEGGEFYALMSVVVTDKSKLKDISGSLTVNIKQAGGAVEIGGTANVDIKNDDINNNATTTISVAWSGGGQIRPPEDVGKDWTFDSMRHAANGFAEKVAQYPQRISAILTKYSGLRSYQEMTNKGTPLDYENAGVYTNSLLDAYMDYKDIWKRLNYLATKEQYGPSLVASTVNATDLQSYAQDAEDDYMQKLKDYYYPDTKPPALEKLLKHRFRSKQTPYVPHGDPNDGKALIGPAATGQHTELDVEDKLAQTNHELIVAQRKLAVIQRGELFEPPLQPNYLEIYPATIIGLDAARRDCRWEMIKIVKEVDAVANDPGVAIDPKRTWQYLNPMVFRQLIPEISDLQEQNRIALENKNKEMATAQQQYEAEIAKKTQEVNLKIQELEAQRIAKEQAVNEAITKTTATLADTLKSRDDQIVLLQAEVNKARVAGQDTSQTTRDYTNLLDQHNQLKNNYNTLNSDLKKAIDEANSNSRSIGQTVNRLDSDVASLRNNTSGLSIDKLSESFSKIDSKVQGLQQSLAAQTPALYGAPPKSSENSGRLDVSDVVYFGLKLPVVPGVLSSPSWFDVITADRLDMGCTVSNTTQRGFSLQRHVNSGVITNFGVNWLALPYNGIHFEQGVIETRSTILGSSPFSTVANFTEPFQSQPTVLVWIMGANWNSATTPGMQIRRLTVSTTDVRLDKCTIQIKTWLDTVCESTRVGWLAWDPLEAGKRVQYHIRDFAYNSNPPFISNSAGGGVSGHVQFATPFSRPPAMLCGYSGLDVDHKRNIRLRHEATNIKSDGFDQELSTWADSIVYNVSGFWLAVE